MSSILRFLPLVPLLLVCAPAGSAQQQARAGAADSERGAGWNGERALELVRRAQELRATTRVDPDLLTYRADARGYVYFYLDRTDTGERNLIKTDQVALELLWRAPDLATQRIVGWRDEKSLPTNIHYHIDHLAVVHDNFGDLIRIGDGDEVRDVLHPAAPGAHTFYEYRLVDSLTLRLPGPAEPVRVYELQVRPTDLGQPALLGSIFVDRRSGALVRMDFTFTPVSYRDRHLDHISISLDNGLWLDRYWLPNRQRLELRRQIPELDIPAGTIIRASLRVGNYRFNEPIPLHRFAGASVTVAPREERESFPFEAGIFAELREEGLGPAVELHDLRREAVALAGRRALSGLPGTRLRLGSASEVIRYNRAEGVAVGLGVSRRMMPGLTGAVHGGLAVGPGHPVAAGSLRLASGSARIEAGGYANRIREVGGLPVVSGVVATTTAFLLGRDFSDPFLADGAELSARWQLAPTWSLEAGGLFERQRSARRTADFSFFGPSTFREVRPIDEGEMAHGSVELRRAAPSGAGHWLAGGFRLAAGSLDLSGTGAETVGFTRAVADVEAGWSREPGDLLFRLAATGGLAAGRLPTQELFVLGGRGTLPGYPFRAFAGDRFATGDVELAGDLVRPWVRGRLRAAAGWVGSGDPARLALESWGARPSPRPRTSVAAGLGLFYDLLQVELARGLGPLGRWELIVDTRRSFWDFL